MLTERRSEKCTMRPLRPIGFHAAVGRPRIARKPSTQSVDSIPPTHALLRRLVQEAGLQATLAYLNQRLMVRITAVLRDRGARRWCETIHDRAHGSAVPELLATGCEAIERWQCPVVTVHADGTFCGHPLFGRDGAVTGVVCHVDPGAQSVPRDELGLLQVLAMLLSHGDDISHTVNERGFRQR